MRLFFASAELAPLAQSGGLGEAVRGLAAALAARGHELTCLLPAYRAALASEAAPRLEPAGDVSIALPSADRAGAGRALSGRWLTGRARDGVQLCLLDLPELYDRDGLYGEDGREYDDNALRFIAFARAAAELTARELPDVLVAHDWHAALAPCVLRHAHAPTADGVATAQVVHNNAYQGRFAADTLALTMLPGDLFGPDGLEFWGDLCLLKAGLVSADRIVTVSPSYAHEVQSEAFGEGLQGLYAARADALSGIANGIDAQRYDPATDAALPAHYDRTKPRGKAACRAALCAELGLDAPAPGLLCTAIGRLAWQKGWDVLADAVDGLVEAGAVLALLGDGDPLLATRLQDAAERHPRRVALHAGWDEPLSRRMYAAADTVLVPSRFEPCGLVQLIAQRYGTLPVAHAVGGLVDTIRDGESGVLFTPLDATNLVAATLRAAHLRTERGDAELSAALMELDVSWAAPAARWETLLRDVHRARTEA